MTERLCRNCVHFQPSVAFYSISFPAACKRTAHRDLVYGSEMTSCHIERTSDKNPDTCSEEGRFWEQRPAPPPPAPKRRRWWQRS